MPSRQGVPLKLYIFAAEGLIGSLLAQDNEVGKEQAVFYLSRVLTEVERKYPAIEKLCLALFFSCTKLRYYLLPATVDVVCQTDIIKYMLMRPISRGRVGKWTLALIEFALQYIPQKAVKGQALVDFLVDHPPIEVSGAKMEVPVVGLAPWMLYFDDSKIERAAGAGVVVRSPAGEETQLAFYLDFPYSNNQAEYETLILGLELLRDLRANTIEIVGDSQLVIRQLVGGYKCESEHLVDYLAMARGLADGFQDVIVWHVPQLRNQAANGLAQATSGVGLPEGSMESTFVIKRRVQSSIRMMGVTEVCYIQDTHPDWRTPIMQYLSNPGPSFDRQICDRAARYVLIGEDLYKKGKDDLLLKCVSLNEAMLVMAEVHEGICGAHQAGPKIRWLIMRYGYHWPSMMSDCVKYAKRCWACQTHGPVQCLPMAEFNPVLKPWPF
ncbi:uncharacterized protein LOC122650699 [Telopea speciosissima]|uniref:uncharacterized protein LOC122650699 n=1 Tax=Telopea speciosissima TaxID=54955 RepID=UPI001CC68D16|nr:uncharacterized protein LOC122650699 [Telopea speciosissima]